MPFCFVRKRVTESFFSWGHVNPIGPRACYDEGKRVAETLTYGFHRQDGVNVRVARIFNTYGAYFPLHVPRCSIHASLLQVPEVCLDYYVTDIANLVSSEPL